jgi:hypothetical protein
MVQAGDEMETRKEEEKEGESCMVSQWIGHNEQMMTVQTRGLNVLGSRAKSGTMAQRWKHRTCHRPGAGVNPDMTTRRLPHGPCFLRLPLCLDKIR